MFRSKSSLKQHTNKTIQKNASLNVQSSRSEPSLSRHVVHNLPSSSQQPSMYLNQHTIQNNASLNVQSSLSEPSLSQHVVHNLPSSSQQPSMYLNQHTIQNNASLNGQSSRSEPSLSQHVVHDLPSSSQQPSMYLNQHTIQNNASLNGQSSRSEPPLSQHVVHDLPSSSQQPSMLELEDDENQDKVSDVEIIDQHGNILRTAKMTTKDVYKLNEGEKILVHVDDRYQLIKDAAGLCARFMTVLLKQPNLCPIDAKDWHDVTTRCGARIMGELRRKFCIIQGKTIDKVLFKIFNQKYRAMKYRTKYKLYELVKSRLDEANNIGVDEVHEFEYTEDQILHALDLVDAPSKVHDHQWESYKAQLRSSKSRKLSEIGKKARGEKLHNHRTGAVSFARVRHEFKSKHKRSPGYVEIFEIQHTGADGAYVEDESRNLVVKANEEIARKISELGCPEEEIDNEKRAAIDRDVWIDLVGPGGEVLGYGAGVTKSDVTSFSSELRKMRGGNYMNSNYVHKLLAQTKSQTSVIESQNKTIASLNKTVETLTKTVESQNEKVALQDEKLETQTKKVEELENTVAGFRGELKLFQTLFQGAGGSSDMFFPTQAVSHEGHGKKKKNKHSSRKN